MLPFVMFSKKIEGSTYFDEISTNYIGCINVAKAANITSNFQWTPIFFIKFLHKWTKDVFDILISKGLYGKFCTGNF